eukprot:gene8959-biopygen15211
MARAWRGHVLFPLVSPLLLHPCRQGFGALVMRALRGAAGAGEPLPTRHHTALTAALVAAALGIAVALRDVMVVFQGALSAFFLTAHVAAPCSAEIYTPHSSALFSEVCCTVCRILPHWAGLSTHLSIARINDWQEADLASPSCFARTPPPQPLAMEPSQPPPAAWGRRGKHPQCWPRNAGCRKHPSPLGRGGASGIHVLKCRKPPLGVDAGSLPWGPMPEPP